MFNEDGIEQQFRHNVAKEATSPRFFITKDFAERCSNLGRDLVEAFRSVKPAIIFQVLQNAVGDFVLIRVQFAALCLNVLCPQPNLSINHAQPVGQRQSREKCRPVEMSDGMGEVVHVSRAARF